MRRVVITGIGIHSCIGNNVEEVHNSLFHGKSGIILDQERKQFGYRSGLTGSVDEVDLKKMLKRRQRVGMPEQANYAYKSTLEALEMAGVDMNYLDENIVGILFGNDSSAKPVIESVDVIREKKDTTLVGSGSIFQSMNSTVTMNLATIFKLKGVNFTISAACASGSHSVGVGYHLIKSGLEDMIVAGGAQEINNLYAFGSFDGLGVFSVREDEPTKASRPFDRDRDGLITSGGAATLILESLESAQRRGAKILAEVVGYGFSSNGDHISNPDTNGQIRSINNSLKMAGIAASEVDYVNAHATSTPMGDMNEAQAIHSVFGNVPVSSTKSMTGHECWMAGASELVYSIIMMQNNFIAPNINFENPDEVTKNLNIISKTKEKTLNTIASNSFGFGGTNSTVILNKYE